LSDEHGIPFALWGISTLKQATCNTCAFETCRFEEYVMSYLWKIPRELMNFPTRTSRRNGKWSGKTPVTDAFGVTREVPIEESVPMLVFIYPDHDNSKILDPSVSTGKHNLHFVSLFETPSSTVTNPTSPQIRIKDREFFRFVAKIAYTEYIRRHDKYFRGDQISSQIVNGGKDGTYADFWGAVVDDECDNRLHFIGFRVMASITGKKFIVARIRLFSFMDVPTYFVVLGETRLDKIPAHQI